MPLPRLRTGMVRLCPLVPLLALAACGGGGAIQPRDPAAPDASVPAADAFTLPDLAFAIPDAAPLPPVAPAACAEETVTATRSPLDLLLLVDRSSSMVGLKWDLARRALTAFVGDPRSAGLGVGLQVFPAAPSLPPSASCASDQDCGYPAATASACAPARACADSAGAVSGPGCSEQFFGPYPPCAAGTTCVAVGSCAASGAPCAVGRPCPGGDGCTPLPRTCLSRAEPAAGACSPASYQTLVAPVGSLPAAGAALAHALAVLSPTGDTPMQPAVTGALARLREGIAGQPGHQGVLVLVTDGAPTPCGPGDAVTAIETELRQARAAGISTYVISVLSGRDAPLGAAALMRFAAAAGTRPFSLRPDATLADQLLDSLNAIRQAALPCAYAIPPPRTGAIDTGKVNVRAHTAAGDADIPAVAGAAACDPGLGGWYYDVDPSAGVPAQVLVCPATCRALTADPAARVDLLFGCKTRVIE
jgi:hypothetical protein